MPSVSIRRPVTVVLWLVVSTLVVLASPLLVALGKLASALTRRPRALIATRLMIAYFGYELAALVGAARCGWAGVAADRHAPIAALHWRLLRWFIAGLAASGRRTLVSMWIRRSRPRPRPRLRPIDR